jgi:multidrug efflux pump
VGALYYRNRRLLALTVLLALVAGFSAWMTLPRREDPELTDRNAIVFTRYPGASAERVEALVTEKIEDELREIEEIRKLESSSRTGISVVAIELSDDITKTAEVWSRIRDKLDEAERRLPEGAETPELEEFTIDAYTVIGTLSWNLPGEPNHAVLRRLAEELEDVLRAVPGTKETDLFGEIPEEIRVEIDAEQLALRGLAASDVARAIRRSDAKVPAGQIRTERIEVPLEVRGELKQLDELRRVPVRYGAGDEVVRLEDVADIRKTIQDPPREMAIAFGRTAVAVAARMESTDRVDRWAAAVREKVSDWKTALPEGIQLDLVFDQSGYTETRLAGLLGNLGLGAALVILVLLVTMGWRSALLVGAALPLSSLMVLTGMMLLGIPLHQMSITGLIIALGLLIDNAIVMVDEVRHRLAAGVETAHAVAGAVRAMAVPLLSSTITTTLAFLPLLLGGGPTSEFVGPMSLSVILAIASSFFLALTVIPALAGMLVREGEGRRWWQAGLAPASAGRVYRRTLDFLLARPVVPILLALLLPVAGFGLASTLDQQFFPPSERDQFPLELRMPALSSIEQTRAQALAARELLLEHPRVTEVHWFLGSSAPKIYYNMIEGEDGSSEYAQAIVQLDREEGAVEVIRTLQARLDKAFPGAQFIARQIEQGPPFEAPIELHLSGPDLDRLYELGEAVRRELAATTGVIHTRAKLDHGRPQLTLGTDEELANLAGFDRVGIARQLEAHLEGVVGGSVLEATEELPVRVRIAAGSRGELDRIAALELVSKDGTWTPISALGEFEVRPELASLPRRDGIRVNTIQGYLNAGLLPEPALAEFRERVAPVLAALPAGYRAAWGGEAEQREQAEGRLFSSVGTLVVLMLGTLVLGFRSFRLAGLIFSVALLCAGLSFGSLWLFGYPFGFMAIVGMMGLIGVAINDAIVVLAGIRADEKARHGDPIATRNVVVRSTRHVVSTTLTTVAGFLPLILAGGAFWPPLAVSIAGGIVGATMLALFFVPAAHVLLVRRGSPVEARRTEMATAPA